ncbi:hypothetical protein OPV22_012764 [Ensete ventricosum]|uniref:Uncharacterized protein n=1 Tax=Ensete ventricosum TaxID=4639 RepID=A0AAV8QZI5_ENSVE|nr:hypothetical protein OPV22_012764 [Ensete ventricosum]
MPPSLVGPAAISFHRHPSSSLPFCALPHPCPPLLPVFALCIPLPFLRIPSPSLPIPALLQRSPLVPPRKEPPYPTVFSDLGGAILRQTPWWRYLDC